MGVGVGVALGAGVAVAVGIGVVVAVGDGVAVAVGDGVTVAVGVGVGVPAVTFTASKTRKLTALAHTLVLETAFFLFRFEFCGRVAICPSLSNPTSLLDAAKGYWIVTLSLLDCRSPFGNL